MTSARGEVLIEEAIVVAVVPGEGERPSQARVQLVAGDHCEGCPASNVCKPGGGGQRLLEVHDPVGVTVGDRVRIAVPGGAVLRASFLVYGLPLVLLLIGVWLGMQWWSAENPMRDLWSFLLGAGLAAAAMPVVARMARDTEAAGGQLLEARITEKVASAVAMEAGS